MGLLSKLFGSSEAPAKTSKQRVVKSGDWEANIDASGVPTWFHKRGKEWLDPFKTWSSPSGSFYLHNGHDGNGEECIALTSKTEGLRLKKTDEGIESAIVTDTGVAFALTEDGTLYTVTAERASQKKLSDEQPEAHLLTPEVCAIAYDEDESVIIKAVDLATGKSWRKTAKYSWPENGDNVEISITATASGLSVTAPDGSTHSFTTSGEPA